MPWRSYRWFISWSTALLVPEVSFVWPSSDAWSGCRIFPFATKTFSSHKIMRDFSLSNDSTLWFPRNLKNCLHINRWRHVIHAFCVELVAVAAWEGLVGLNLEAGQVCSQICVQFCSFYWQNQWRVLSCRMILRRFLLMNVWKNWETKEKKMHPSQIYYICGAKPSGGLSTWFVGTFSQVWTVLYWPTFVACVPERLTWSLCASWTELWWMRGLWVNRGKISLRSVFHPLVDPYFFSPILNSPVFLFSGNLALSCGQFLHATGNVSLAKDFYERALQISEANGGTEFSSLAAANMVPDEVSLGATCALGQLLMHSRYLRGQFYFSCFMWTSLTLLP